MTIETKQQLEELDDALPENVCVEQELEDGAIVYTVKSYAGDFPATAQTWSWVRWEITKDLRRMRTREVRVQTDVLHSSPTPPQQSRPYNGLAARSNEERRPDWV